MTQLSKRLGPAFGVIFAAVLMIALGGCATGKSAEQKEPEKTQEIVVAPLNKAYSDIFVFEIETTPELKKDYDYALKDCEAVLISTLLMKNKYKRVELGKSGEVYNRGAALLVRLKVSDMRIASGSARFWGGALAGNSYMYVRMTLVDAVSQKVLRDEDFNSSNNAFAAAWTFGGSDRSLPSDMGKIMADYLEKVVPAN